MKYVVTFILLLCASVNCQSQVIEPEFMYECGILVNDTSLIICEKQNGKITSKASASMFLTGIGKVKTRYQIPGNHSTVKVKKSDKITLICKSSTNAIDPNQVINVYSMECKSKYRQVQIGEVGTFTGAEIRGNRIAFKATKHGTSSYKIEIDNLPTGEYAVTVLNPYSFNCFCIED